MPTATTTRVFMNGNSQAVRIPAEFRLDVDSVHIYRNAAGELVLRPVAAQSGTRGQALMHALQGFDEGFLQAVSDHTEDALPMQERDTL